MAAEKFHNAEKPKGAEKRAFPRYKVDFIAHAASTNIRRCPCKVRDICIGGLFLEYDATEIPDDVHRLSHFAVQDMVNITCKTDIAGTQKEFIFQAQVLRASNISFAVRFINPDIPALQILLQIAQTNTAKKSPDTTAKQNKTNLSTTTFNGKSAKTIISSCDQAVAGMLNSLNLKFNAAVVEHLFETAKDIPNIADQNTYFDSLKIINNGKDIFKEAFVEAVTQRLADYSPDTPYDSPQTETTITAESLSLVEDEEFDDWLADTTTVSSIETRYKNDIADLSRRLSVVLAADINKENNPYGPALFSHSFHDAIKSLDLKHKINLACHKVFKDVLLIELGDLYKKINGNLIDNNIMPVIEYKVAKSNDRPEAPSIPDKSAPVTPDTKSNSEKPHSSEPDTAGDPPSTEKKPRRNAQDIYDLVGELRTLQKQLGHQTVSDFIHEQVNKSRTSAPEQSHNSANSYYSANDVLQALSKLKSSAESPTNSAHARDYKSEVLSQLTNTNGTSGSHQIGTRESRIMDVAGNIFHSMTKDMQVSGNVRDWIQQLEIPVLKIAITDDALFRNKSHPVRQVVNKISQLEVLVGEAEESKQPEIKRAIEWIINLINSEFNGSTDVFSRAIQQLDLLLKVQDKSYGNNLVRVIEQAKLDERSTGLETDNIKQSLNTQWNKLNNEERESCIKQTLRLSEGDWIVFEPNSEFSKRLRIAWIAAQTQKFVFVDLFGAKNKVLNAEDLAKLIHSGEAVVLDNANEPAMDRAQYSMLQDLHRKLLFQSTHDQLTGLINRREFEQCLTDALASAKHEKTRHALFYVDLDKFNVINNACGYEGGDKLLKEIAYLLKSDLNENGVLARIGSDEFALLLKQCTLDDAMDFIEEQREKLQEYRLEWDNKRLSIGTSVGFVPVTQRSESTGSLLQAAESSCGVAKDMGGDRIQMYDLGNAGLSRRNKAMKWAVEVDRILEQETLYLRCQRITPIVTHKQMRDKYEILLGVWDQNGGSLSTPEFIDAAERYNRMPEVDHWVIKNSFRWIVQNQHLLEDVEAFSINLSGRSINSDNLFDFIVDQIETTKVPTDKICFEVTETAGIANLSDAAEFIKNIKQTGCSFALDDFGSGMSSYAYLKNLPVDYLKIDGVFVKDMVNNPSDFAVVKSICEIGHFMGKKIIAEFIENDEILNQLKSIGVDYGQGFSIHKPIKLEELF